MRRFHSPAGRTHLVTIPWVVTEEAVERVNQDDISFGGTILTYPADKK
jgi:hypothetical protein